MLLDASTDQRRWAKFFPLAREAECLQQMQDTVTSIPGAYCMVLSSLDGMQLASVQAGRLANTSRLAAITGSLCGLGETLGKELGQAQFRDVLISTEDGIAVVQRLPAPGNRMVLLTAANHEANVGIVSAQSRYCAQALASMAFISG
ncbi:MAG: roadblock/LC7 domain-containing protein [Xanthomonadaceae bacterium]|nr:roadblock/LC7 domain-containing protein [Xanthomonadaceae bacterium]